MCPFDVCKGNIGNCQFCDLKRDCVLLAILNKLEKLEAVLGREGLSSIIK